MKRTLSIILLLLAAFFLSAAPDRSPQEKYIEKYSALAVQEMYRSGVPASITLAQGLLESRYGLSELAVKGNNHFGIKCHNWTGGRMYHDDDARGECFRVYESADESFRDHSDFLRYRDRYKFLFDLEPTDYQGWAHGLKKAGYATDPAYPKKLIKLIEDYRLHEYDGGKVVKREKTDKKQSGKKQKQTVKKEVRSELPESPNSIEEAQPLDAKKRDTFRFPLSRQMYSRNGVPFVRATKGESYASIAANNNLFLREILRFNDLDREQPLEPGTVVYLQAKKKGAAKGLDKHVVDGPGETLRDIAQRYGVRMKDLVKMNGISSDSALVEGDIIKLRK